jgi:GntR family transcriptional regulator
MLLQLDFSSAVPIYMQIRNQIILGIADGRLSPGEKLPTIRALADETGINMMTANKAYQLLKQEGYISADRRSGATVTAPDKTRSVLSEKSVSELRLLISEAKLKGVTKEAFLALAGSLCDDLEV